MTTPEAAALTEQERFAIQRAYHDSVCGDRCEPQTWATAPKILNAVESIVAARLADSRPVVSEAAITEVLLRHREAQWSDGRSGCSPCGNHAEVTTREEAQAAQAIGHMDSYTDYCSHIAAALTAALPHMGDARSDA